MSKPAVVVFDLGKVLLDFDYGIMARQLESLSRLKGAELKRVIDQSPLLHEYETGQISTPELYIKFVEMSGFSGSLEDFSAAFADIFSPIPEMLALHEALRERAVPVFIFSNTNELAVGHIRRQFPFFANFDGFVFSHEVGAMKPAAKIYEAVEAVTARSAAEILYIDDRPENIEAGTARGWQAVLHQHPHMTRQIVNAAGLV